MRATPFTPPDEADRAFARALTGSEAGGGGGGGGTLPMLWVNGTRVQPGAPHISPLDRGFTLADGLFETMLVRRGRIFRAAQHMERLHDGARVLRLALPDGTEDWLDQAMEAAVQELDDAAIRLTVSRGVGAPGLAIASESTPTVVITIRQPPAFPARLYDHGLSALTATARRNEHGATAGVKSLSYTEAIIALAQAHDAGADEAILLDTGGHISEASASNVFICKAGALLTPALSCGVLAGVTRAAVIELAPALGLGVEERPLNAHELAAADEAFLTSSLRGIAPLVRVDQRAVGRGIVGAATRSMMQAYAELVDRECTA